MSPTEDDVRRQLHRLLASAVFAGSGRMSRFLEFVVEKTLAGEGERLKEYVVGVEVFDRDTSYDPRVDSIVRVEAARLRSKLAEYYAGAGRDDEIILTLPKGGYAPAVRLEKRPAALNGIAPTNPAASPSPSVVVARAEPRSRSPLFCGRRLWALGALLAAAVAGVVAWVPSMGPAPMLRIAVLPFMPDASNADTAALAEHLTEGVTAGLVRNGRFAVVASSAARAAYSVTRRPRDVGAALDADLLVEARVSADSDRVRVEARAASGSTEQKLWVRSFAGDRADTAALAREIAEAVADDLGPAEVQ
jgi:TolB-like protein